MAARKMNPIVPRRGYTMIEVVVALAIVAVVAGMAVPSLHGWSELARLREPADELAHLVHQARARAFAENQKYVVVLDDKFFSLRKAGVADDKAEVARYALSEDFTCTVKGWNRREWEPLRGRSWMFAPGDFTEPLALRFQRGNQMLTQRYDPLSALVADEELIVP